MTSAIGAEIRGYLIHALRKAGGSAGLTLLGAVRHLRPAPCFPHTFVAQTRNRPCPVTSRTGARFASRSRLRWIAALLAPVSASACAAPNIGWAARASISRPGVRPCRSAVSASARARHAANRSSVISAASTARCAPWTQAASRRTGISACHQCPQHSRLDAAQVVRAFV